MGSYWQLTLPGEGKLVFFKGIASSKLTILLWMASYNKCPWVVQVRPDGRTKVKTENMGHRKVWGGQGGHRRRRKRRRERGGAEG